MRVKDISDLKKVENNKIFYVTQLPSHIGEFQNVKLGASVFPSVDDIRKAARVFPCKLVKTVNKNLGGYRMDSNSRGYSFTCKNSLSYGFVSLTEKEAKKTNVPYSFFEYNSVSYIQGNILECNGLSWFEHLTMYDGKEYWSYTWNSLCDRDEFSKISDDDPDDENSRIYFGDQIRVFTSWDEVKFYVQDTVDGIIKECVDKINKHTDSLKKDYYFLQRNIEKGELY